jgi:carboxylate-amine ligase
VPASRFTHPGADPVGGPVHPRGARFPAWARWNDGCEQSYTLGVEDEVMLLDPRRWSLAQCSDRVLAELSGELSVNTAPETHAAVVELTTGIHSDVDGLIAELGGLRGRLAEELQAMGLAVGAGGTHPLTVWAETEISSAPRYRLVDDSMRALARREPTMALHVHVGVHTSDDAIRLLNRMRASVPALLALSANSPFWQGRDVGFASARSVIFQAFPRTGPPRHFESYGDYVRAVDPLITSTALPDPSYLWWDVRLQPRLGTVEVRVMDAQSTVRDVAPLVAFIQSLARLELEDGGGAPIPEPEVLAENRFLAARDGMDARLIDPTAQRLIPVREVVAALVAECRPHAAALGCANALAGVQRLAAFTGADRQRDFTARHGPLQGLVAHLADRFAPLRQVQRT